MSTSNNRYNNEVQLKWKSEEAKSAQIHKLSEERLLRLAQNTSLGDITALSLAHRGVGSIDNLNGLGALRRLDLSDNKLQRLTGGFNAVPQLSMLNVSNNELASDAALEDLRYLTELRTLNVGFNPRIKHIRSHIVKPLTNLLVLVANECGLTKASFLKFLPNLNTLVLSRNKLTSFTLAEVGRHPHLLKLSLGNNELSEVPPDLAAICEPVAAPTTARNRYNQHKQQQQRAGSSAGVATKGPAPAVLVPLLEELRLNGNRIRTLRGSGGRCVLAAMQKIKTLDLAHNRLGKAAGGAGWADTVALLPQLPALTNLAVHDNDLTLRTSGPASGAGAAAGGDAVDGPTAAEVEAMPLREDVSAEAAAAAAVAAGLSAAEVTQRRLVRKYTLCLFQRSVGKENKLHVQLVVLDSRRVKDKWSHREVGEGGDGARGGKNRDKGKDRGKDRGVGGGKRSTAEREADEAAAAPPAAAAAVVEDVDEEERRAAKKARKEAKKARREQEQQEQQEQQGEVESNEMTAGTGEAAVVADEVPDLHTGVRAVKVFGEAAEGEKKSKKSKKDKNKGKRSEDKTPSSAVPVPATVLTAAATASMFGAGGDGSSGWD